MHLSAILAVLGSVTLAGAHPTKRHTSLAPRGIANLDAFRLPMMANYTSAKEVQAPQHNMMPFAPSDPVEVATEHVKKMNPGLTFRVVNDHYVGSNGISHVRFKQTMHDIDIDNADYNVNIDKDGNVFSHGGTFYHGESPPKPTIDKRGVVSGLGDAIEALSTAVKALGLALDTAGSVASVAGDALDVLSWVVSGVGGAYTDPTAALVYFITGDGALKLLWRVETDTGDNWLQSYVDKETSEVHGVVDWVSDATYEVYPWPAANPDEADRKTLTDPWDLAASEYTWISDGTSNFTTTRGNNGIAQVNPSGGTDYISNHRPESPDLTFEYDYEPSMSDPTTYVDASVTQLFYTTNKYHDVLYLLGFNEVAGNFEINNGDKGGKGNDFVVLNAQDGSGKNNANFATPPDGQTPRMRMYIWDLTSPPRDCSFDAGVVIHEYTHGLSTRLTGGPTNSNCLSALESGGMGEGWGDFMGTALRLKADDTRDTSYPTGEWVIGNLKGIRKYLYSTDLKTNPLSYLDLDTLDKVHDIGTVWATMLYEVLWNLIDKHGKNDGDTPEFNNGVPKDGKYLAMKLVIDAMALQPCNPNFIQARDAILDADKALTGGQNACEIWQGFAKRGLGEKASYMWLMGRTTSNKVPDGLC